MRPDYQTLIVGAGFAGIGVGILLDWAREAASLANSYWHSRRLPLEDYAFGIS